jgi:hypothetical protein
MVAYGDKSVFWQALVFTIIVFSIGLIFGFFMESWRADKSESSLMTSEINLLDEQIKSGLIRDSNISCELAKSSVFAFADKIYAEALNLEKYDSRTKFEREIMILLHKRYDLLRMMLWSEAVSLKDRCSGFHTIVYFFDYDSQNIETKAKQDFYSRMLVDLKNRNPSKVLLMPVAGNLDIASVNLAMESYNLDAPAILIDEKTAVSEIITLEELEKKVLG